MEKTERLALRCAPSERRALEKIARREAGGNLSLAIRKVVREAGERRGIRITTKGGRSDAATET
jgi:Flp pilus assembly protein CpaB